MNQLAVIAFFVFVGLAAAYPGLTLKNERVKRSLDLLKTKDIRFLDPSQKSVNKKDVLEELESALDNLLKRQQGGAGPTEQPDGQGQGQGQGDGQGKGKGDSESFEDDDCGMTEEEHIGFYLFGLRTQDPYQEMISQMEYATESIMDVVNVCTGEQVFTLPDDMEDLKAQAAQAYNDEIPMENFWQELGILGQKYQYYHDRAVEYATKSANWRPICTRMTHGLDREIEVLNKACMIYKMWREGYFN